MPSPVRLNDTQIQVLRWIADDCPSGVMSGGYRHRVTASALWSRGLVRISGKGKTWQAELTDRGREYLEHLDQQHSPQSAPEVTAHDKGTEKLPSRPDGRSHDRSCRIEWLDGGDLGLTYLPEIRATVARLEISIQGLGTDQELLIDL